MIDKELALREARTRAYEQTELLTEAIKAAKALAWLEQCGDTAVSDETTSVTVGTRLGALMHGHAEAMELIGVHLHAMLDTAISEAIAAATARIDVALGEEPKA